MKMRMAPHASCARFLAETLEHSCHMCQRNSGSRTGSFPFSTSELGGTLQGQPFEAHGEVSSPLCNAATCSTFSMKSIMPWQRSSAGSNRALLVFCFTIHACSGYVPGSSMLASFNQELRAMQPFIL